MSRYSSMDEYLLHVLRGYSSTDEYSPHVFQRVFVHGRILASCFWEGIRPWTDTCLVFLMGYSSTYEYLPHVLGRVFVHGRILASCFWEGIRLRDEYSPHVSEKVLVQRRILATRTEYEANEYEYLFVFVIVRGMKYCPHVQRRPVLGVLFVNRWVW